MPTSYTPITGTVQTIQPQWNDCCTQTISILTTEGPVNVLISGNTYVADSAKIGAGMQITAFYDANAPVPLIYPPQYRALLVAVQRPEESVAFHFFDRSLTAYDNALKINLDFSTEVTTANGQDYTCPIGEQYLMVFYSSATRSIPPQTTPRKIIVMC